MFKYILTSLCCIFILAHVNAQTKLYHEPYRPQIHFSPQAHWMNDPNGMVYYKGTYHLFFQYYPGGMVWGPMHWGQAISTDLVHWKELPIALYPDKLGYIFSGSAVVDAANTSGFGKNDKAPLVAIFTHHNPDGEKAGRIDFQNESLAYSLDDGKSWTKYGGNPVLKNPGIKDFRDPKVSWYAPGKKWLMTLAAKDHIAFYSSPDLKTWKPESDFGKTIGAHRGVWECPDLFPMTLNGKTHWVLIVNLNPGGPNGGSATQYFVGQFDGKKFTPNDTKTRWLDYGPDEYAGITWSNTGNRRIFLGWMSNWLYGDKVPTSPWRSAMTVPRELALKEVNGKLLVASQPVKELNSIAAKANSIANVKVAGKLDITKTLGGIPAQYLLKLKGNDLKDFSIVLSNKQGQKLVIGYSRQSNSYYIDRTQSGQVNFNKTFSGRFTAPRLETNKAFDMTLVADAASAELFADGGLNLMTSLYFPTMPYDHIAIIANDMLLKQVALTPLKSIWK